MRGIVSSALCAALMLGDAPRARDADAAGDAAPRLPRALGAWSIVAPPRTVRGKQLFDYMDGAAEVHRMYGFRALHVWRYASRGGGEVKIEVFDLGTAAGAYGDFTHARDLEGRSVRVGQNGHLQAGILWFWKGRHLVCVSPRGAKQVTAAAVVALGRVVAALLRPGQRPPLAGILPKAGLRARTVRYFRAAAALRYHYGDFPHAAQLELDGRAAAVLADYRTAAGASVLLVLRQRSAQHAAAVARRLATLDPPLPEGATREPKGKWRGLWRRGRMIWIVLEAPTRAEALRLGAPGRRRPGARYLKVNPSVQLRRST